MMDGIQVVDTIKNKHYQLEFFFLYSTYSLLQAVLQYNH